MCGNRALTQSNSIRRFLFSLKVLKWHYIPADGITTMNFRLLTNCLTMAMCLVRASASSTRQGDSDDFPRTLFSRARTSAASHRWPICFIFVNCSLESLSLSVRFGAYISTSIDQVIFCRIVKDHTIFFVQMKSVSASRIGNLSHKPSLDFL